MYENYEGGSNKIDALIVASVKKLNLLDTYLSRYTLDQFYDEETVEFKRIFIRKEYRGCGLGRELLYRLEADARIKGFRYAILETGELLVGATAMYQKDGFKVIPNYGQYIDMPESLCMKKKL